LEALFPDFGSDVSTHWKQPFHPSEAKHHPLAFKVSSAGNGFLLAENGGKPQNRGFSRGFIEGLKAFR
jgi:hypothetical protein